MNTRTRALNLWTAILSLATAYNFLVLNDIRQHHDKAIASASPQPAAHPFNTIKTSNIRASNIKTSKTINAFEKELVAFGLQQAQYKTQIEALTEQIDALVQRQETIEELTQISWESRANAAPRDTPLAQNDVPENTNSSTQLEPQLNLLEARFDQLDDQSEWHNQRENNIQNTFINANLEQSRLQDVECKSTMCRIEISHIGDDAMEELFTSDGFLSLSTHQGKAHTIDEGSENARTILYLSFNDR